MIVTPGGVELSSVERSPAADARQYEYDATATGAGMAVVTALSDALRTDPLALKPLQTAVDVDALDTLLSDADDVAVSFSIADHTVTVTGDGVVTVAPAPTVDRLDPPR